MLAIEAREGPTKYLCHKYSKLLSPTKLFNELLYFLVGDKLL
jgi:hypothetical protein